MFSIQLGRFALLILVASTQVWARPTTDSGAEKAAALAASDARYVAKEKCNSLLQRIGWGAIAATAAIGVPLSVITSINHQVQYPPIQTHANNAVSGGMRLAVLNGQTFVGNSFLWAFPKILIPREQDRYNWVLAAIQDGQPQTALGIIDRATLKKSGAQLVYNALQANQGELALALFDRRIGSGEPPAPLLEAASAYLNQSITNQKLSLISEFLRRGLRDNTRELDVFRAALQADLESGKSTFIPELLQSHEKVAPEQLMFEALGADRKKARQLVPLAQKGLDRLIEEAGYTTGPYSTSGEVVREKPPRSESFAATFEKWPEEWGAE